MLKKLSTISSYVRTSGFDGTIMATLEEAVASKSFEGCALWNKFGRSPVLSAGTNKGDCWEHGGAYTGHPVGAAETMEIFSSSASDTAAGTVIAGEVDGLLVDDNILD